MEATQIIISCLISVVAIGLACWCRFQIKQIEAFWRDLKSTRLLVDQAKTEEELQQLWNNQILPLWVKASGDSQNHERSILMGYTKGRLSFIKQK